MLVSVSRVRPFDGPNSMIKSSNTNNSDSLTSQKIDWRDVLQTSLSGAAELFCLRLRCRDLRRKTWKNTRSSGKIFVLPCASQPAGFVMIMWANSFTGYLIVATQWSASIYPILCFTFSTWRGSSVENLWLEKPFLWITVNHTIPQTNKYYNPVAGHNGFLPPRITGWRGQLATSQRQNYGGGSEKPETRPCQEKLAKHSPNLCIEVNPLELNG